MQARADYDVILADYGSMKGAHAHVNALRCKLRILDTFGTSPQYNDPRQKLHSASPALGIRMDQYFAYYPEVVSPANLHSPPLTVAHAAAAPSVSSQCPDHVQRRVVPPAPNDSRRPLPQVAEGSSFIGFTVTQTSPPAEKVAPSKK